MVLLVVSINDFCRHRHSTGSPSKSPDIEQVRTSPARFYSSNDHASDTRQRNPRVEPILYRACTASGQSLLSRSVHDFVNRFPNIWTPQSGLVTSANIARGSWLSSRSTGFGDARGLGTVDPSHRIVSSPQHVMSAIS